MTFFLFSVILLLACPSILFIAVGLASALFNKLADRKDIIAPDDCNIFMPYVFSAGYASLYHCGYVRYGGLPAGGRRCGIRTGREAG